jgi:gag-polypeptide of LTR copia-type
VSRNAKEEKKDVLLFRGMNLNVFKTRMQVKLKTKGLWQVVSGEGDGSDSNDDTNAKEHKAFNILIDSLDDDNIVFVCHLKASSDIWKLLIERFESKAYTDVSHIIHDMHTATYDLETPMQKHLTKMCGFQQQLTHVGSNVADDMLGKVILTSVRDIFPTTVEILSNRLLAKEEEVRRASSKKRKAEANTKALLYTESMTGPPMKKRGKCFYCSKMGHHAFECRNPRRTATMAYFGRTFRQRKTPRKIEASNRKKRT